MRNSWNHIIDYACLHDVLYWAT